MGSKNEEQAYGMLGKSVKARIVKLSPLQKWKGSDAVVSNWNAKSMEIFQTDERWPWHSVQRRGWNYNNDNLFFVRVNIHWNWYQDQRRIEYPLTVGGWILYTLMLGGWNQPII